MVQNSDQLPKKLLHTGRYALFWISSLLSNIGTWMQQIAQPWIVLNLSNSAFWVGLDSFAMNAPGLLFTLFGGVLADRYDRKKVILFFQSIQFLCILTMLIFLIIGWLKVW
ncbi:MAG: MFS transporter, partial [Bacteroidia bacterium]